MTHFMGQIGLSGNEKLPGSGNVGLGRRIDVAAVKVRGDRATGASALPIKLDTGDAIASSNQPLA